MTTTTAMPRMTRVIRQIGTIMVTTMTIATPRAMGMATDMGTITMGPRGMTRLLRLGLV